MILSFFLHATEAWTAGLLILMVAHGLVLIPLMLMMRSPGLIPVPHPRPLALRIGLLVLRFAFRRSSIRV